MTEEELIIGDDAIHGEVRWQREKLPLVGSGVEIRADQSAALQEAYCFYDHMDGLEPTESVQKHAAERQRMINATSRNKHQSFLEGQAVESPQNGARTPPSKDEEEGREVKMD